MATALKFVRESGTGIDPEVKSWIDNVIVPALVREYLTETQRENSALASETRIVAECGANSAATAEVGGE